MAGVVVVWLEVWVCWGVGGGCECGSGSGGFKYGVLGW